MKDNQLDLSSKKVQETILQSLRNKSEWKATPGAFYEKGIDDISDLSGYNVYDAPKGYKWVPIKNPGYVGPYMTDDLSLTSILNKFTGLFSDTDSSNSRPDPQYAYRWALQPENSSSKKLPFSPVNAPISPQTVQTAPIRRPDRPIQQSENSPFYTKLPTSPITQQPESTQQTPGIKRPDRPIIPENQPFYGYDLDGGKLNNDNEPLIRPTTNVPAEPPPYYFKDWLKDYLEKAPGSVKPNMRVINTGLRGSEIYNILRMPYASGNFQIKAANRIGERLGNLASLVGNLFSNSPDSSISPQIQNEPTFSEIVQSTLPITQYNEPPQEVRVPHTPGIKQPIVPAREPSGNQPFYTRLPEQQVNNDKEPLQEAPKVQTSKIGDEWQPTEGAFYERGIDNIDDLSGYNVWDAPKGYKWAPIKNPGYVGPYMTDDLSLTSILNKFTGLFSDTDSSNSRPDPQYAYRWALQHTDEQRPPTFSELLQKSNNINNTETESPNMVHTSGIQIPEQPAQPQNQPFYVNLKEPPQRTNNNELALYGAPVPMAGALPPLSSQGVSSPNQNISLPEMPRKQGNAGMGTLGETPGTIPSGSFKQTALYSLFGKPQTGKASTNNFVF
jgi:hypothetical protein